MSTRQLIGNVTAALGALALSIAVGEAALRTIVTLPLQRPEPEIRYRPHPVRRFTLLPAQAGYSYGAPATVDGRGFRMNAQEHARSAPGATTLIALGDSFTFGLGVRDEETWPARLETRLRERTGRPMSVVNAGTISYGVFQEADLLRSAGLQATPVMVVHGLYWNDFMNAEPPSAAAADVVTPDGYFTWDRQHGEGNPVRRGVSWLFSHSAFLFTLRQTVEQQYQDGSSSAYGRAFSRMIDRGLTSDEWAPIEKFYRDLKTLGDEHGFVTFSIIMPVNAIVGGSHAESHPFAIEARRRLDALAIPYLDAFTLWSQKGYGVKPFLPQGPDGHLNADGYSLIADAIAERLLSTPAMANALKADPGLRSRTR